jgi:Esterase/lipase
MIKINPIAIIGLLLILTIFITGCMEKDTVIHPVPEGTTITSNPTSNEVLNEGGNAMGNYTYIETSDTICDVVDHPAFQGFGQFVLPLDRGTYNEDMQLNRVGSLLPYHRHVDPDVVVDTINYMIDEVNDGQTIFYDFYTEQQKKEDPSKKSTGLFYFKGEAGAPFAVICPGGGYSYVGSVHEGFPHAIELSNKGYNAFVLQYRVGGERIACEDLAAATSYIFENADMFEVSTEDYSLWGSSAGARMAARLGSNGAFAYGGDDIPKPYTVVMAYTGHSDFSLNDPPTFVTSSEDDPIASVSAVERRVESMKNAGIDVEYRKYKNAGHGFGLGTGTDAQGWIEYAIRFWKRHMSE